MSRSRGVIQVEPMRSRDLDDVLDIEAEAHPTPWPRGLFLREIEAPHATLWVARQARVLGFVDFWRIPDGLHVLNLAVCSRSRRQGVGRLLMDRVVAEAKMSGVRALSLEVRRSNAEALRFYDRFGFVLAGIKHAYYRDRGEDALFLVKEC